MEYLIRCQNNTRDAPRDRRRRQGPGVVCVCNVKGKLHKTLEECCHCVSIADSQLGCHMNHM